MSDLEDDWWEKDIESFTVPTSTDQKQRGVDDSSEVHENSMQSQDYNLDKGKLLAFMKNGKSKTPTRKREFYKSKICNINFIF